MTALAWVFAFLSGAVFGYAVRMHQTAGCKVSKQEGNDATE